MLYINGQKKNSNDRCALAIPFFLVSNFAQANQPFSLLGSFASTHNASRDIEGISVILCNIFRCNVSTIVYIYINLPNVLSNH